MAYRPGRRRGACSCIDQETGKAYIFRGYPGDRGTNPQTRAPVSEDLHLTVFDYTTHEWSKLGFDTSDQSIWPSSEAGASCTIIDGKLYHFGGWEVGDLNNDVYVLDLAMLVWRHLEPSITSNQPLAKNKCGLVPYSKTMLLVFGGYGYPRIGVGTQRNAQYDWERQILHGGYIGWTNEIHLFDLISRKWIVPVTTGVCPAPCAAFSFNRIDRHRVLLFGGRQKPERVNEVHILDMATWHWSGAIVANGPEQVWPMKRSLHTAVCLVDPDYVSVTEDKAVPKQFDWLPCAPPNFGCPPPITPKALEQQVLLLWGMDNNGDPCKDSWILDVNSMTWRKISLPNHTPLIWHTTDCYYVTPTRARVMTFGGATDNLFKYREHLTPTSCNTSVFEFGVATLYEHCQQALLSQSPDISRLKPILPSHIYRKLVERKLSREKSFDYSFVSFQGFQS